MFTKRTALFTSFVITILILSLLGCSDVNKQSIHHADQNPTQATDPPKTEHQPPVQQHKDNDSHKQPSNEDVEVQHNPLPEQEQDESDQDGLDAPDTSDESRQDANQAQQGDVKQPDVAVYNPARPMLMGLAIGQPKDLIVEKYGIPLEQYIMEDPSDPITVYEYDGFLIGYNKLKLIQFIDVSAREVDPGLNGVRLQDSLENAVKALGNPDTRTPYVLNYYSSDAILKFDIDPLTNTITSIKLFSSNG